MLPLTLLYLLPTVNKPQRVVDLIVQQINDRHISPRWLQSVPRGPLCCVYSNAVSLMENSRSGGDECAINSLNHTFYLQVNEIVPKFPTIVAVFKSYNVFSSWSNRR